MSFCSIWHDSISVGFFQMLLLGLFFLIADTVLFLAMWYMFRGAIIEYGYPKRSRKAMEKKLKSYSKLEELLLIRLVREAKRRGVFLWINLIFHFVNIVAFLSSVVGFAGAMVTLADGWAFALLLFPEITVLFFTTVLGFVPQMIWMPSERKRYQR